MNDAWDPADDVEPLDDASLGLLSSFREASGPSEEAEARMLAGLRARIAAEPAAAVPAEPVEERPTHDASNLRTIAIAAVAFAAGVALTTVLPRPAAPPHSGDVSPTAAATPRPTPAPVRGQRPPATGHSSPSPHFEEGIAYPHPGVVAESPALAWPLANADLQVPQTHSSPSTHPQPSTSIPSAAQHGPSEGPAPTASEGQRGATRSPSGGTSPSNRGTASRGPLRPGRGPSPAGRPAPGASPGAWAPSLPSAPSAAGVGAAARNPAVGSNSANPAPPPPDHNNPPPKDGQPPSADNEPEPEPKPDPEEPPTEEESPEERCAEELDACLSDANEYCETSHEDCWPVFDFCQMRAEACGGGELPPPPPFPGPPEEPEPWECADDYDLCIVETDALCMLEKLPPLECSYVQWECDYSFAMCEGFPPPPPPY